MSYEIVRNCRIEYDKENNKYYAVLKTASNNVYPHYYEEWTLGKDSKYNFTKEELEKTLLLEFFHGNLQGGGSRFRKAVKQLETYDRQLLDRYYRLDKCMDKVRSRYYKLLWNNERTPQQEHRYEQLKELNNKLYDMRNDEAKNVLYDYMKKNTSDINARKVPPFVIIEKSSGTYVIKVTKTKYFTSTWSNTPHLFDSKELYARVKNSQWWNERFIIEQVSIPKK